MADNQEKLRKIYTHFKKARDSIKRKDFETSVNDAKRVFKGTIFDPAVEAEMKNRGIPAVKVARGTTNALRFASILTANRPELKALPKGRGDGAVATLIQRAFTKIWEENNGNQKNFRTVLGTIRDGLSHYNAWTEKYGLRGDVKIKFNKLDGKNVYYDPDTSEDGLEDWAYRIVARAISPAEAKELYGLEEKDLYYSGIEPPSEDSDLMTHDSIPGGQYDDVQGGQQNRKKIVWEIEHYEQTKTKRRYILDRATMQPIPAGNSLEEANQVKINATYQSPSEVPMEQRFSNLEVVERDMSYSLVVGNRILDDTQNPYGRDQLYEPVDPIVPIVNIPVGELYPRGNMYFAVGPLEEICKRRGQSIAVVAATMGSPILFKEGTINVQKWNQEISKPRALLGHNADPDEKPTPLYQPGPDLSRVFALEDRALQDLNDVFNLTPVMMGQQDTGRMSGRLAAMLKEFGMEGNSYFLSTVEEAFRKLGVALIVMAIKEWPFQYWERLLEDEDKDPITGELMPAYIGALQKIQQKDVSIIDYDIGIRSGSSLPTNRMARLDMAIELSTTPVHPDAVYDAEAVLTYLDDPQAQGIIDRKSKVKQLMAQGEKMAGEMEMMMKQMEDMSSEIKNKQAELDTLKIQQVEEKGNMKFRYEIQLEKLNERLQNYKALSKLVEGAKEKEMQREKDFAIKNREPKGGRSNRPEQSK